MCDEMKRDIEEMVDILKNLDRDDLLLVKGGAKMLEAKKELEKSTAESKQPVQ